MRTSPLHASARRGVMRSVHVRGLLGASTYQFQADGKSKKQKAEKPAPAPQENTAIYVTSLPADVDEDEMVEFFSKFGIIAESAENNNPRIKLYKDDDGNFKGDALVGAYIPLLKTIILLIIFRQCSTSPSLWVLRSRWLTTLISASVRRCRRDLCASQKQTRVSRSRRSSL